MHGFQSRTHVPEHGYNTARLLEHQAQPLNVCHSERQTKTQAYEYVDLPCPQYRLALRALLNLIQIMAQHCAWTRGSRSSHRRFTGARSNARLACSTASMYAFLLQCPACANLFMHMARC